MESKHDDRECEKCGLRAGTHPVPSCKEFVLRSPQSKRECNCLERTQIGIPQHYPDCPQSKRECCEKCREDEQHACNGTCICHTKNKLTDIPAGEAAKLVAEGKAVYVPKSVEGESWEKEFDALDFSSFKTEGDTVKYAWLCEEKIKSFITDLLDRERERLATAVEGTGKVVAKSHALSVGYHKGYADGNTDAAAMIRNSNNL